MNPLQVKTFGFAKEFKGRLFGVKLTTKKNISPITASAIFNASFDESLANSLKDHVDAHGGYPQIIGRIDVNSKLIIEKVIIDYGKGGLLKTSSTFIRQNICFKLR